MNKSPLWIFALAAAALLVGPASCALPEPDASAPHAYNPDLYAWRPASWSPFTAIDGISGFAFGTVNGTNRYVAVAATGVIAWSEDGDIWFRAEMPAGFSFAPNAVCYGEGIFIAAGKQGRIAVSQDGVHWTAGPESGITGFGTEDIAGIAYGGGVYAAVGGNSNISCSTDGEFWINCRDASFGGSRLNDIAYDRESGRFYIVGDGGKRGWSDNPFSANWNYRGPAPPFNTSAITRVAVGRYGGGIGIGIVFNEGRQIAIAPRNDFTGFDADIEIFLFDNKVINGIAWGNGYFVAAGDGAMLGYWPSANPSQNSERYWRALSFSEFKKKKISALAACNGRFFIGTGIENDSIAESAGGRIGYSK